MTCEAYIINALAPFTKCQPLKDGIRVSTQVLYPDGDGVSVVVFRDGDGYRVSDDGLGWSDLITNGIDINKVFLRKAEAVARDMGLALVKGAFVAPNVSEGQLGAAIVIVANASQRWVYEALRDHQQQVERTLKTKVNEALALIFPKNAIKLNEVIDGDSTKSHRISNIVHLDGRRILVDSVVNNPISIASTFLKFSDIGKGHPDYGREAVVEDLDHWNAEDVNILANVTAGITDIEAGLDGMRQRYRV